MTTYGVLGDTRMKSDTPLELPAAMISQQRGSSVSQAELPNEIWRLIIEFLPKADQRTALAVSRLLHDISRACLFAHLVITFGVWTGEPWADDPELGEATVGAKDGGRYDFSEFH
ncbi:hypothetical protein C2E23DRAFT_824019 [Lenzites betulinus]|nr:hypothetical protein C2E23DRAFT_824019 [Lenzites betulinus]